MGADASPEARSSRQPEPDVSASRERAGARALWLVVLGLSLAGAARPASAALGETLASIPVDQQRLQGTLRTTAMPGYLLHEIATPTGTVVRQFTSPGGMVFGVSWEGPFLPDFHVVLGASYSSYVEAARVKRHGRGPLLIQLPDLVFESAGHQRGFRGRAYLPELLPDGVTAEAVR